jgi:hypothetical protein
VVTLVTAAVDGIGLVLWLLSATAMTAATLDGNELEANCRVVPPVVVLALVLTGMPTPPLMTTELPLIDTT